MATETTEKLVKLSALQTLAEKLNSDYATKTELEAVSTTVDELSTTIDGLVTTGGEANVLEGVSVNGTALEIADKIVDILIETGTEDGTISVNGADVAVKGLAALAYKSEVSEDELSDALKETISAKAESSDLEALEALVGTLPEDTTATTVVDYVAAEVASIIADADEDYDTLKEISDWISSHADSASTMNTQITSNTDAITALTALVGTLPEDAEATTVIDYIAEAISDLSISDYVTADAMASTLEDYVTTAALTETLANYYTSAEIDAMIATDDEVTAMLDEVFSDDTEE